MTGASPLGAPWPLIRSEGGQRHILHEPPPIILRQVPSSGNLASASSAAITSSLA
jgi:hypothetical protein